MNHPTEPGIRTDPNPDVSTANPAATGDQFSALDKQIGGLVVNGWTYRLLRMATTFLLPKADMAGVSMTTVQGAPRGMKVIRPDSVTGTGAILLIHGGGFVIGTNNEARMHGIPLARGCGVPVFCSGYRLAPQHPFPAALDDSHAAWTWLQQNANELGIDPAKIVVGGISAGGGHAASLVQRLHDEGGTQPAGQLLVYPMLDDRTAARSDVNRTQHRVWSNRNNQFGWRSYLGHPPGQPTTAKYAAAARREDLSGLPPAWVGVGGADLFLDEDRDYAQRMQAAGVDVTYVEVDGGIHGFDGEVKAPLTKAFHASAVAFSRRFTD